MNNSWSRFLKSILPLAVAGFALIGVSGSAFGASKPDPVLTISVDPEITLGSAVQIIVNAKTAPVPEGTNISGLVIQSLRLNYPIDIITGLPKAPSLQLIDPGVPHDPYLTNEDGDLKISFDPAALGIPADCGYTLRAQSAGDGTYSGTITASIEFCIKEISCDTPFSFALTDVTGPGELLASTKNIKYSGDWYLTYTVKACTDIVAGTKVQGGVVAWANYEGAVVSAGSFSVSTKNKNSVITWILPAMTSGDEHTITVHVSGNSSTAVGSQPLSGAWSAVYQTQAEANNIDPITLLPKPIPAHKSEYTPRATYEVVTVLTP